MKNLLLCLYGSSAIPLMQTEFSQKLYIWLKTFARYPNHAPEADRSIS